jgi:ABC-2 type transport system permease protein
VFLLPKGFAAGVASPDPVGLEVLGSADAPTATQVARAVARSYADGLDAARVAVAGVLAARPGLTRTDIDRVAEETIHGTAPVRLEDVSATTRVLDVKTQFAAGMAVFFLLFTVQFGVSSLIDERSAGTLGRLLAAPVPRGAVLVGKLLTSVVLGVVSLTVLVAGTGITSVVASLARTSEQAGSWQAVVAVTLGLLGGTFFPIQQSGDLLATLSLATPHAWFMRGLGDLAGGGGALEVLPAVVALLAIAAVTGGLAALRIGRVVAP